MGGNTLYYNTSDGAWMNNNSQTAATTDVCLKYFIYFMTFLMASVITKDTDHLLLVSGVLEFFLSMCPVCLLENLKHNLPNRAGYVLLSLHSWEMMGGQCIDVCEKEQ